MTDRIPYVGGGRDGCLRSAEVDRTEADGLDFTDPRREELHASAAAWEQQADRLVLPSYDVEVLPESAARARAKNPDRPRAVLTIESEASYGMVLGWLVTPEGERLWSHTSSNEEWLLRDLTGQNGMTDRVAALARLYPQGYDVAPPPPPPMLRPLSDLRNVAVCIECSSVVEPMGYLNGLSNSTPHRCGGPR